MTKGTNEHPNERNKDAPGSYALVNGLNMYYEIHGSGQSLVLLPGGFMTVKAMGEIVPQLAVTRRVIAVELQGHGHTADIERPFRYELMTDDIAALIKHLELERADIFGFSLGGGVGLQTAIQHPEVVRKLALASTAFKRDGWYPEVLAGMASMSVEAFAGTPIHEAYLKTSPMPEAWPTVVARMRQLLTEDYDWAEGVAVLRTPTLILVGDADGLRIAHMVEFYGLLGGGKADGDLAGLPPAQLAVLPATTHVGWAPVSWDHGSHRTAPPDHHGISRCTHARGQVSGPIDNVGKQQEKENLIIRVKGKQFVEFFERGRCRERRGSPTKRECAVAPQSVA